MSEKYNGWHNYATWRVNLEMLDGISWVRDDVWGDSVSNFADQLKSDCEERLSIDAKDDTLVYSYAMAFINDVDWYEIAEHINEDYELGLEA